MDMSGEQRIPAPRAVVWEALNDPEILKLCIPGCQELVKSSDTQMSAKVVLKVGPVSTRFYGAVTLSDLDLPTSYRITGEGQGGMAGFAKGEARVRLEADGEETILHYAVEAQVGGPLAQLGARLIDATAKQMSGAFFKRFAAEIIARMAPAGTSAAAAPLAGTPAREAPPARSPPPVAAAAPSPPWRLQHEPCGPVRGSRRAGCRRLFPLGERARRRGWGGCLHGFRRCRHPSSYGGGGLSPRPAGLGGPGLDCDRPRCPHGAAGPHTDASVIRRPHLAGRAGPLGHGDRWVRSRVEARSRISKPVSME